MEALRHMMRIGRALRTGTATKQPGLSAAASVGVNLLQNVLSLLNASTVRR
jgi:hypothetical protein